MPKTALADAMIAYVGAKDLEDLMRGYTTYEYQIGADAVPLAFRVAEHGDEIARDLIRWAECATERSACDRGRHARHGNRRDEHHT